MKKIIILIIVPLCLSFFVYAQNFASKGQGLTISDPEKSFRIGEKLQYRIEWLGIPIGSIILNIAGIEKIDGWDCYHIIAGAMPNQFFSRFYDFGYTVHTYIDTDNFYTRRFEKIRRVKDKSAKVVIDFDWQKNEAIYKSDGSAPGLNISSVRDEISAQKPTSTQILAGTQDIFSSFYYLRLLGLKENKSYSINIYYDQRNWTIDIKVKEPFLREFRKKGAFALFEVSMDSELSEFILGKRRLSIYFTTDSRRIPFEFKLGTGLGTVRGIIREVPD